MRRMLVAGNDLFRLHDTFGLRPDFVADIVRNYGLDVDRKATKPKCRSSASAPARVERGREKVASPVYLALAESV